MMQTCEMQAYDVLLEGKLCERQAHNTLERRGQSDEGI